MKPTKGRIVIFHAVGPRGSEYEAGSWAALISQVNERAPREADESEEEYAKREETVDLAIFFPSRMTFKQQVRFSVQPQPGCWSWPSRVE